MSGAAVDHPLGESVEVAPEALEVRFAAPVCLKQRHQCLFEEDQPVKSRFRSDGKRSVAFSHLRGAAVLVEVGRPTADLNEEIRGVLGRNLHLLFLFREKMGDGALVELHVEAVEQIAYPLLPDLGKKLRIGFGNGKCYPFDIGRDGEVDS